MGGGVTVDYLPPCPVPYVAPPADAVVSDGPRDQRRRIRRQAVPGTLAYDGDRGAHFAPIPSSLIGLPGLPPRAFQVWAALADHWNRSAQEQLRGMCYPTVQRLAALLDCDRHTIHESLRTLRELDLLRQGRKNDLRRYSLRYPDPSRIPHIGRD